MIDIMEIADNADMIVSGYAFTVDGENVRVLNLNYVKSAAVINSECEAIETTMDDIELDIVMNIYRRSKEYMEDRSA